MLKINEFFKDLKIIELASVLAGPLAGSFFAELGAEVIKIENKLTGGDVTRSWKVPQEATKSAPSAYYHSANFGKTSVFLDFKSEDDYKMLMDYVSKADIIISNYQKRTAEKLNIDFKSLLAINPNLIFIQLNAFTYEDPRPGYDLVMQAEAGYISMCGEGTIYAKMPVAMIDILAAHQMKEAALVSLLHKYKTGEGSVIHVSLYKSALSALINQGTAYLMEDFIPQPIGTKHPNIAPYGEIIESQDGIKYILAVGSDAQFAKLLDILNAQHVPSFEANVNRVVNRSELSNFLNQHSKEIDAQSLSYNLSESNIPFAAIKNMKEVFNEKLAQQMVFENRIEGSEGKYISNVAFEV